MSGTRKKISIQILTPSTQFQLRQLAQKIREIEGLEQVDMRIPIPSRPSGEMSAEEITGVIIESVMFGTAKASFEHISERIAEVLESVYHRKNGESNKKQDARELNFHTGEAIVSVGDNQTVEAAYINSAKQIKKFDNRKFTIDPAHTYALLIGTSEYEDDQLYRPILPIQANLETLKTLFTDEKYLGLSADHVIDLYNLSSAEIKKEIRRVSRIPDIKTLIVYYAGHGNNSFDSDYFLTARDSSIVDHEAVAHISYKIFEELQHESPALQKLFFLDACHSGNAVQKTMPINFSTENVVGNYVVSSTSPTEPSHFDERETYTYFTGALIDVLQKGVINTNEYLSLSDLYESSKIQMELLKKPLPLFFSNLNIFPHNFFISKNPSFSLAELLKVPNRFYASGKYKEAKEAYLELVDKHPENTELKNEFIEFENNIRRKGKVNEANLAFYLEEDYATALDIFRELNEQKPEGFLRDKIYECQQHLDNPTPARKKPRPSKRWQSLVKSIVIAFLSGLIALQCEPYWKKWFEKPEVKKAVKVAYNIRPVIILKHDTVKIMVRTTTSGIVDDTISKNIPDSTSAGINANLVREFKEDFKQHHYEEAWNDFKEVKRYKDPEIWMDAGSMYANGLGVAKNYPQAIVWYTKAAQFGDIAACDTLGAIYQFEQRWHMAAHYFHEAARAESPFGACRLAWLYESRHIPSGSPTATALYWYQQPSEKNYEPAVNAVKRLLPLVEKRN